MKFPSNEGNQNVSPATQSLSHRVMEEDLAFRLFSHKVVATDINWICCIAEQHAGSLCLNHAATYHAARDEQQKHLSAALH